MRSVDVGEMFGMRTHSGDSLPRSNSSKWSAVDGADGILRWPMGACGTPKTRAIQAVIGGLPRDTTDTTTKNIQMIL